MINYHASTFTWRSRHSPHPYYRYEGGFVGKFGDVYDVRSNLQASFEILDDSSGRVTEVFLGSPCRGEYTIADRNLFQVPSFEFRMAFSRHRDVRISRGTGGEKEKVDERPSTLSERYLDFKLDLRRFDRSEEVYDARQVIDSSLAGDLLNARSTYRDEARNLTVAVEYPVNLINLNDEGAQFQVCTGPVLVPDLATWDGSEVSRGFLAHVAFTSFDHVEFILRRDVEASESDREWLARPVGRDRNDLVDPDNRPTGYPPRRWQATTYNEVWALDGHNVFLRASNGQGGDAVDSR